MRHGQLTAGGGVSSGVAPGFLEVLRRTVRSKCPVCGIGALFVPYFQARSLTQFFMPALKCNKCSFKFGREPGYYFGILTPTLSFLALGIGVVFALTALLVVGRDLSAILLSGGVGVALGVVFCFRTAIAVYISIDHAIDPPKSTATMPSSNQPFI